MSAQAEYRNGRLIGLMYSPKNSLDWYQGFFVGQCIGAFDWWWKLWLSPFKTG